MITGVIDIPVEFDNFTPSDVVISGWAYNSDSGFFPGFIEVLIWDPTNGLRKVGHSLMMVARADVQSFFSAPISLLGFQLTITETIPTSTEKLLVLLIDPTRLDDFPLLLERTVVYE